MAGTLHAFEFLAQPQQFPPCPLSVLFGDDRFLKQLALAEVRSAVLNDGDTCPTTFDGTNAEWRDVLDEVSTVGLFGGHRRLVVLEDADRFVTENRSKLEAYAERRRANGVLVLLASQWPSNTRLYKALSATGLQIDCRAPQIKRGKYPELDVPATQRWIVARGSAAHGVRLDSAAAGLLLDISGPHFGLLDQELAKLALFVEPGGKVTADLVREVVGGWKTKSVWELIDAACDGNASEALCELDHLLRGGAEPVALFGGISWGLRRYAAASAYFLRAEQSGLSKREIEDLLAQCLKQAGIYNTKRGTAQLLQLKRGRAGRLYRWLLEADLAMKLTHSAPHRARFVLERLILRLAQGAGT